jgi:hypothetical protein
VGNRHSVASGFAYRPTLESGNGEQTTSEEVRLAIAQCALVRVKVRPWFTTSKLQCSNLLRDPELDFWVVLMSSGTLDQLGGHPISDLRLGRTSISEQMFTVRAGTGGGASWTHDGQSPLARINR